MPEHEHDVWTFTRTSADLLEMYYDDLVCGWGEVASGELELEAMEERVLDEQKDVEYQAQWVAHTHGLMDAPEVGGCRIDGLCEHVTLARAVSEPFRASPLVLSLLRWAGSVLAWVRDVYPHAGEHNEAVFRVGVNAPVIPSALLDAQLCEGWGDRESLRAADVSYELVHGCFDLLLPSLAGVVEKEGCAQELLREAVRLKKYVDESRARLHSRLAISSRDV